MVNNRMKLVRHALSTSGGLFLFCLFFANCNEKNSQNLKEIEETIRKADASIEYAVIHKNLDSLMTFYAENAQLLPTAEPIISGKAAIKEEWKHVFQIPDFNNKSTLSKIEISNDGSMAYTMGSYLSTMQGQDGKEVQEPGKWVTIWKKQTDQKWQIVVDIYNTDIMPPVHK